MKQDDSRFFYKFSYVKKIIEVVKKTVLNGPIVLFEVVKKIKVKKQCRLLNYAFVKENTNINKHDIQDFEKAPRVMVSNFQKKKSL